MSSQTLYRQLVLFYAANTHAALFADPENMTDIPSTCDFVIFFDQSNRIVEQAINQMINMNKIKVYKSSEPVKYMFNILHENLIKYSSIIIICDKNIIDEYKWNKSKEVQMNTIIKIMEPSTTTIGCILNELHRHNQEENVKGMILIDSRFFPNHQCPRCSEVFHRNDDLQQHDRNEHISATHNDVDRDFRAKILFNHKSNPIDRYILELYCIPCEQGFQTLEARVNHTKNVHRKD